MMNGNHLPAGQPLPAGMGGAGAGGVGGVRGGPQGDMGPQMGGPPVPGTGPRRRPPPQYNAHHYQHHQHQPHQPQPQHVNHIYPNSYMNPFATSYYPQGHAPPHYPNGGVPNASYMYTYARSPPVMHQQQYPPIVSSNMQHYPPQPYSRPPLPQQQQQQQQQSSPALSTPPPYQTSVPPVPIPIPQTPSSTQSSQVAQRPPTPPTPQTLPQEVAASVAPPPVVEVEIHHATTPFRPPLPWLSVPESEFPTRPARSRRKRRIIAADADAVELPNQQPGTELLSERAPLQSSTEHSLDAATPKALVSAMKATEASVQRPETPSTQDLPSEGTTSADPTTPASTQTTQASTVASVTPTKPIKAATRSAVPAVPLVPVLPKAGGQEVKASSTAEPADMVQTSEEQQTIFQPSAEASAVPASGDDLAASVSDAAGAPAPVRAAPKLWTGLFASAAHAANAAGPNGTSNAGAEPANGAILAEGVGAENGSLAAPSFTRSNTSSLAEALRSYRVNNGQKIAFLEPRGLINTGNMCYMNSVLQVLIFCIPFYDFLDQVGRKAAHSFKSETPLIDAMIMFMREFKVIDSAVSVDQLRRRLKSEELEQYGEPFTPEFVYDAIRNLPRFASMRRGHQQDAEEFLGFLLESLHDECAHVMRNLPDASTSTTAGNSSNATPTALSSPTSTTGDSSDWMEVGRRQRAAVTRSSGHPITSSPINKIFGGQLRSELRVQGLKDSVTLEPYQPLQLDIGSAQVRNILDALKGLTRPETLHGDFGSPRGKDATATKQVFIESLPPVLILHLKRFQFDAEGTGTIKIWKKVGYPLELELPKEVFSRQKRNSLVAEGAGLPKYRLLAVVYHHGKNASGGHYTVDLRRQDGREWIRMDDTVIRRVRSEDVAEGGAEEDASKPTSWAAQESKKETSTNQSGNRFEGIGDEDAGDDDGWNQVSGSASGTKKWSSVVNGATNGAAVASTKGKQVKDSIKDNKVAYILFYQRI